MYDFNGLIGGFVLCVSHLILNFLMKLPVVILNHLGACVFLTLLENHCRSNKFVM